MQDGKQPSASFLVLAVATAAAIGVTLLWAQGLFDEERAESSNPSPSSNRRGLSEMGGSAESPRDKDDTEQPQADVLSEERTFVRRDRPSEVELRDAFDAVRRDLQRCHVAQPMAGEVVITFLGASGGVQEVEVRGPLSEDPAARCVERGAYRARVAPFARSVYVSTHPLALGARRQLPLESEVQQALERLAPKFARCAAHEGHWVRVAVTIAGASGRPTQVLILPPLGGTTKGDCMHDPVMGISVEPFESPSYTAVHRIYF